MTTRKTTAARAERLLLERCIEEGYRHRAWHGPNLKGALRGVSAAEAARRPGRGRHAIWEIALHCAYWKYVVRRRLLGLERGSFPLEGSNWFPVPAKPTEAAWRRDRALLERAHAELLEALRSIRPLRLDDKPRGSTVSTGSVLTGIAFHDIYHAGQIQLIKRMLRASDH
jgi:uncharacterized damage-inducible protein DinB